jgi:RPA family protein
MFDDTQYKRFPAIRCWIKHVFDASYDDTERVYHSIFGKLKRIHVIGTVIEKVERYFQNIENYDQDNRNENTGIEFILDDTTGRIKVFAMNAKFEEYESYKKGDSVEVIGLLHHSYNDPTIRLEIIKKTDHPNSILYHDAKIIKRIKRGDIFEIPEKRKSKAEDIDLLFDADLDSDVTIKEKIFRLIDDFSKKGKSLSINELKQALNLPFNEIKKFIKDLEFEGKIYSSDENTFESR